MTPLRLGVNVDHVATVRQARLGRSPDPVEAALACEKAGADSIVAHLREDRRHIQDEDVTRLRRRLGIPLNLEMGLSSDVVAVALRIRPDEVTFVPERRQELTTEGGLDVAGQLGKIQRAVRSFHDRGIGVSLFIDPDLKQVEASRRSGSRRIEIHTGAYAGASRKGPELRKIVRAARLARLEGLEVAAGHGLDLDNVQAIAEVPEIEELNIGHSIVSHALQVGMGAAVQAMKDVMRAARRR